jgi:hypothetical protein
MHSLSVEAGSRIWICPIGPPDRGAGPRSPATESAAWDRAVAYQLIANLHRAIAPGLSEIHTTNLTRPLQDILAGAKLDGPGTPKPKGLSHHERDQNTGKDAKKGMTLLQDRSARRSERKGSRTRNAFLSFPIGR